MRLEGVSTGALAGVPGQRDAVEKEEVCIQQLLVSPHLMHAGEFEGGGCRDKPVLVDMSSRQEESSWC